MRRRESITGLVVTAGWPFDVRAGQAPLRVGFLPLGSPDNAYDRSLVELFRQGPRRLGLRTRRRKRCVNGAHAPRFLSAMLQPRQIRKVLTR